MANNIYTVGLNHVGSYQSSGMPFCSGNIDVNSYGPAGVKIEFPYVTNWIKVGNNHIEGSSGDFPLYVGFSQEGVQGTNYYKVLNPEVAQRCYPSTNIWRVKVTEIWLSGSCATGSIIAGLTNIPTKQVTAVSPSGSNWSGSIGVG